MLTLNNDSYWKEFKVEGTRVITIARDKANDTRTVIFPYVEGKEIYNASLSVEIPKIGYKADYNIRIKNNEITKKSPDQVPTQCVTTTTKVTKRHTDNNGSTDTSCETKHKSDKTKTLPDTGINSTETTAWASLLSFIAGLLLLSRKNRKSDKNH